MYNTETLEQTAAQRTHDQLQAWDFSISEIEQTNNPHKHHPLHRLQMWNFSALEIPDISSSEYKKMEILFKVKRNPKLMSLEFQVFKILSLQNVRCIMMLLLQFQTTILV